MNYQKKIAKKKRKINELTKELGQLIADFQSICEHNYHKLRSWNTDDGFSRRECMQYTEHKCEYCGHIKVEALKYNS
jgi:hypothetical protein